MRVFIIGFMGSGKSVLGKKLAGIMKYNYIDLDDLFEERYKISIGDFFNKYGEAEFRWIEHKVLLSTFKEVNVVISTGGGTACFSNNINEINANGVSVYIKVSAGTLYTRLNNTHRSRPLLNNLSGPSLKTAIGKLLEEREKFYEQAQLIITENQYSPDELAGQILRLGSEV